MISEMRLRRMASPEGDIKYPCVQTSLDLVASWMRSLRVKFEPAWRAGEKRPGAGFLYQSENLLGTEMSFFSMALDILAGRTVLEGMVGRWSFSEASEVYDECYIECYLSSRFRNCERRQSWARRCPNSSKIKITIRINVENSGKCIENSVSY